MKKTLLALCAILCTLQLHAQTWTAPTLQASTLEEGSVYYLENVGQKLRIASGGWWGTQAILNSSGLQATAQLDAATKLYTLTFSSGKTLFRDDANGNVYTDQTKDNKWNIQLKDAESFTYTIQAPSNFTGYKADQYLGSIGVTESTNNGNAYLVKYNRDETTYANYIEWHFLSLTLYEARIELYNALNHSKGSEVDVTPYEEIYQHSTLPAAVSAAAAELTQAIIDYKVSVASPETPSDFTFMIVNQGFDDNSDEGWTGAGTINYHEVEYYQSTFNLYQTISGLPAGKYTLKAQGFERPKSNDSGAAYRAGSETIYASLYAKAADYAEKSTPFNSLYKHAYSGTGSLNGYVNTMAAGETMFKNANNYYEIVLDEILLNEGNTLTIGGKSDFQQTGYWALFDNFRLYYNGAFGVDELIEAANDRIAEAQALLTQKVQQTVKDELTEAISQMQQAIAAEEPVQAEVSAAKAHLDSKVEHAYTSKALYDNLEEKIAWANQVLAWYQDNESKSTRMETAIATALIASNNLELTATEINNAANLLNNVTTAIDKRTYTANWSMGDVTNVDNAWSLTRTKKSKNFILFWEKGYGEHPTTFQCGSYTVNIDDILKHADIAFDFYTDSLKFIKRGSSKTDTYRMVIRLRYATEWEASGSGVDNLIGLLTLTPWAAPSRDWQTLYHEVGHCFQYQVHCDNGDSNGWMYGYGNYSGNAFWEQCAQWQAYKIKPSHQFSNEWFNSYLSTVHKDPLHEGPRYENFFIQDYWTYLHGMDMIGRLWNESKSPEDPIQAYKRITGNLSQTAFNDEMWDCAARFASWDIPALRTYGSSYIASRPTVKLNSLGENWWQIDSTMCIENYGHNIIRLNSPTRATTVTAYFEGMAGADGFRKRNVTTAGWRYGFVAVKTDGTRLYGDIGSPSYSAPTDTLHFDCPANMRYLWLVVSGAPRAHWTHPWDNDNSNDEQWPYKVKFNNTNRHGYANISEPTSVLAERIDEVEVTTEGNRLFIDELPEQAAITIHNTTGSLILNERTNGNSFSTTLNSGVYLITITTGSSRTTQKVLMK